MRHGLYSTYNNHACRCDECRAAKRDYMRRLRGSLPMDEFRAQQKLTPTKTPHGTIGRYQRHGCRCEACRKANSDQARAWRASKRVAS